MEGWIKLHRSSLDHWLYNEKRPKTRREAWEDMLLLVNHEESKVLIQGSLIDCARGQSLLSLGSWARQFNWSIQMVRTFFNLLKNDSMITLEGLQKTTRLTICNYDIYQDKPTDQEQTDNTPTTDSQQTDNRQITTNKNDKKNKNGKNDKNDKNKIGDFSLSFVSSDFLSTWEAWIAFRKLVKKPYKTHNGMVQKYNKLLELSENDPLKASQIVQKSIDNEWIDFYELKINGKQKITVVEDPVDKLTREAMAIINKQTPKDGTQK